jgi:AAA family ATP:ADP antiporter
MRDKLRALPGIETGEESKVSMLLIQSAFLGIFIGAFDITAHSLFLSLFDVKMMARGYVISGLIAIIFLFLSELLKKQAGVRLYKVLILIVLAVLTMCLWAAYILSPVKEIVFLLFILFGPVSLLVMAGLNDLKKSGIQTGLTGTKLPAAELGFILGIIVISFLIPLFILLKLQVINILLLGVSSIAFAVILRFTDKNYGHELLSGKVLEEDKQAVSKFLLSKDPYVRIIVLFTSFSVISAFFIQYLFMAVTRQQFPDAESMASFLGFFTGGLMLLIFLVKIRIFRFILHYYGLLICLVITPVMIAVFTFLAISEGSITGYAPGFGAGFIIFLIALATLKVLYRVLSESLETPSLRMIYQTFESRQLNTNSQLSEPLAQEIMVIISGLLLTGIGLISGVTLLHFAISLLVIALIWSYIALKLFREYKKSIAEATEKSGLLTKEVEPVIEKHLYIKRFAAHLAFRKDYYRLISGDYSVLGEFRNSNYYLEIIDFAISRRDITLIPVLKKFSTIPGLDESIRFRTASASKILQENQLTLQPGDEKIREALRTLSGTRKPLTTEILRLFRDNSIESKRLALCMIGKFGLSDLLTEVCECLAVPGLAVDATEVLKSFGAQVEDELIRYYLIKAGNPKLSKTILTLIGKNCTEGTRGFIFSRLWSNSRQLKEIAVKGLISCNFTPNEDEKQRLTLLTSEVIGTITWYLSAKIALERENNYFLLGKIEREVKRWNIFLFDILSVTYGSGTISRIVENIQSGTMESVNFALEMTDIVVSEDIKLRLIYLLDCVPDEEKLKNLFQFYPGEIPNSKKLQEEIINRDYNLISLWTKACVLRTIAKVDTDDMAESVTALLFSPEELIQEEAASLIARSDPEIYSSASVRLNDSVRQHLDGIVSGTTDKMEYLFEKVNFLSEHFDSIDEDDLLTLAYEMKYIKKVIQGSFDFPGGLIVWLFSGDGKKVDVHILLDGAIEKLFNAENGENVSFYYLPVAAVEQYHFQSPEKSEEILKFIDDNEE